MYGKGMYQHRNKKGFNKNYDGKPIKTRKQRLDALKQKGDNTILPDLNTILKINEKENKKGGIEKKSEN